jgi:anti-anti-sigma factor
MTGLQIDVEVPGAHLEFSGRLDSRTAAVARAVLHSALDQGQGDLLLRVSDLEIWDSEGMGVLVGAHSKARRLDRHLVLVDVAPRQERLLRATRVGRLLATRPAARAG